MINLTIDGVQIQAQPGTYVIDAAEAAGITIPNLCYIKKIDPDASCRLCLVEIEGQRGFKTSCSTRVEEGMVVHTQTDAIRNERREILDLMLSHHPADCFTCQQNGDCKFQDYCYEYGVSKSSYEGALAERIPTDGSNPFFYYDPSYCILCRRCVNVCDKLVGANAIGVEERGFGTYIAPPLEKNGSILTVSPAGTACSIARLGPYFRSSAITAIGSPTLSSCKPRVLIVEWVAS